MTITRDSVLFHFDAGFGERPVVGNLMDYFRASGGYELGADNFYSKVVRDTPRIHTTQAKDGKTHTAMSIEPPATQRASSPFDISHGSWNYVGNISLGGPAEAIFEDQDAFNIELAQGGTLTSHIWTSAGSVISGYQTAVAIIEIFQTTEIILAIRNSSAGTWVGQVRMELPSETLVSTNSGGGSNLSFSTLSLGRGPNGGELWRMTVMAQGNNPGHNRQLWFYPFRTAVPPYPIHYLGLTDNIHTQTPFEGSIAGDTHMSTLFSFQPFLGYLSFVSQTQGKDPNGPSQYLVEMGASAGSELGLWVRRFSDAFQVRIRDKGSNALSLALNGLEYLPGDYIEGIWTVDPIEEIGTLRVYANGDIVGQTSGSIIGLVNDDWDGHFLGIGNRPSTGGNLEGGDLYERLTILKLYDAIPDAGSLNINELRDAAADVFNNLDILSSGRVF